MSAVHEKTYVCSESLYKAATPGLEMCAWRRSARDCLAELGTVVAAAFGGHRWDHGGRPGKLGPPPSSAGGTPWCTRTCRWTRLIATAWWCLDQEWRPLVATCEKNLPSGGRPRCMETWWCIWTTGTWRWTRLVATDLLC